MAAIDPVLSLTTVTEVPTVEINGEKYALLPPDAMSAAGIRDWQRLAPRLEQLWNKDGSLSPAEQQTLSKTLNALCRAILSAPDRVHDALTDLQRFQVYEAFVLLPTHRLQAFGSTSKIAAASPSRGGKPSPASRGSMAGTRSSGIGKSRRVSSGRT